MDEHLGMTRRIGACRFVLDTNCINSRQADACLNQLERWAEDGVIRLVLTERSSAEAAAGHSVTRFRKTLETITTATLITNDDERARLRRIEEILFPHGAKTPSDRNDAEIVFAAGKYSDILITRDGGSRTQPGGILGASARLLSEMSIRVMRPEEAVAWVEDEIQRRDRRVIRMSEQLGLPRPNWVGND